MLKPGSEYTYPGLSTAIFRGALERPWLPPSMWKTFFQRALSVGVRAAPTVFLMSLCVGFVIALVLQEQLAKLSMQDRVPRLIWVILNQQLAPLLTATVFIGRSVAGTAAELANMKIAEEIKALETMGVDLSRYLLLPVLAAFGVMLPVMTIYTLGVGLIGAFLICSQTLGMSADQFVVRALEGAQVSDVLVSIGKAWVFSLMAAMIAFNKGLNATGGSDAVGRVATAAVVTALVSVTAINAVITGLQLLLKR